MTATHPSNNLAPLDGLPKSFVNAMRTLFDIMDDQRTGYVRFSEIERRWQDDGAQGMPRGVLGSLRKVTPSDGYLSFERFCAGLQISLLRNKIEDKPPGSMFSLGIPPKQSVISSMGPPPPPPPLSRPPSAPILDQDHHPKLSRTVTNIPSSSQASGSHHSRAERTMSMPHLEDAMSQTDHPTHHHHHHQSDYRSHGSKPDIKMGLGAVCHSKSVGNMAGPPKPPRVMDRDRGTQSLDRNGENRSMGDLRVPEVRATHSLERDRSDRKWGDLERSDRPHRDRDRNDHTEYRRERGSSLERLLDPEEKANHIPLGKAGIRSALQTWHKERRKGEVGDNNNNNNKIYHEKEMRDSRVPLTVEPIGRGVGDGGDGSRTSVGNQVETHLAAGMSTVTVAPSLVPTHKKSSRKREARRHTLQNGIDYSLVRRLKQLEAERDMLVQGYDVVERARSWYRQQLQQISERIHYLPQGSPQNEPSMEAQQEMLHFQLARIHEVNSHLRALMEASERGLPSHMNLAIRPMVSSSNPSKKNMNGEPEEQGRVLERLKDQNHLLTEEVSMKSERITDLEREKAALLRELFQSRSSQHLQATSADSTFIERRGMYF